MKRTAIALTLIFAFLFTILSGTKSVQVAYAQFEGLLYDPPIVTVLSPSPNGTCNVQEVPLNVTVQIFGFIYHNIERIRWLNYSLDGQTAIPMNLIVPSDLSPGYYVHGNDVLTGLSDGTHSVTIRGKTSVGDLSGNFNTTISFRVDTSTTPIAEPSPIILVAATIASVAIIGVSILFYFNKRKHLEMTDKQKLLL